MKFSMNHLSLDCLRRLGDQLTFRYYFNARENHVDPENCDNKYYHHDSSYIYIHITKYNNNFTALKIQIRVIMTRRFNAVNQNIISARSKIELAIRTSFYAHMLSYCITRTPLY